MARLIALVPAAGAGARFGGTMPKQYADLSGRPLLAWTLDRLAAALPLATLVVALEPEDRHYESAIGVRPGIEALRCGGATRAATVTNAMVAWSGGWRDDDWVLVHDAARPCVPASALQRLLRELADDPVGGLLAVPVADTLKREDPADAARVLRTEARSGLWQAQTPQMFRAGVLQRALEGPGAVAATDEAQAVEALAASGACARPRLVTGSSLNIKVTYAADLMLAAAIIAQQSTEGNA